MKNTVLLVVDVQNRLVDEKPYAIDKVIANIQRLIEKCRSNRIEVVYIQHDGNMDSGLEPYTTGWEIHPDIAPAAVEKIINKKFNSAFKGTNLKQYLTEKNVGTMILAGLQTEYCIDTTCRVAFELGYQLIMPEMTNTTFDNGELCAAQIYEYHNHRIFKNRFAIVEPLAEALERIERIGQFS